MQFGDWLLEQADVLAGFTEADEGLTRTYLSAAHRRAGDFLRGLMQAAGMQADYDALGNVVGRYAGREPGRPAILTGSHMDSVVNAGRYDGLFGVLSPIAAVGALSRRGVRLNHPIEVIAFGDEEGVRFGVTMIGSSALSGSFDPAWLDKTDADGISLRRALTEFGGDPDGWAGLARDPAGVACFVESHIEQGPVLLSEGRALGVVTAIAGASRVKVTVTGLAGHAGTVPMGARKDALAGAAEMVLAAETLGKADADRIVVTVGKLGVEQGGAINVIPGRVEFFLDIRSASDTERRLAASRLEETCRAIAARRGLAMTWHAFFDLAAAPCDAGLQAQLAAALERHGESVRHLPSGAGHDAMRFARRFPTAMLFVRCGNGGISHHPTETMTAADADQATSVLLDFFEHFQMAA